MPVIYNSEKYEKSAVVLNKCRSDSNIGHSLKHFHDFQSRTATEAEILTKHDEDYLELMKKTERMSEEDLKKVSARYDGMYFNPVSSIWVMAYSLSS